MNLFHLSNMQIVFAQNPLGFEWHHASPEQAKIVLIIVMALIISFFLVKQLLNRIKMKENQRIVALAKMRKLGLSNNQIKVLNYIMKLNRLSFEKETSIKKELFENSIGNLIRSLENKQVPFENILNVCKDISLTYGKLYHTAKSAIKLIDPKEIDLSQIIFFTYKNQANKVFFGKIVSIEENAIIAKIFKRQHSTDFLKEDSTINISMWRVDDAEYYFTSNAKFNSDENDTLEISIPENFTRGQELVRPYIDVIIDCELTPIEKSADPSEKKPLSQEVIIGRIVKMNDNEAVLLIRQKLSPEEHYWFDFTISDFRFSFASKVIASSFDATTYTSQSTLEFRNMSPAALRVIKLYLDSLM